MNKYFLLLKSIVLIFTLVTFHGYAMQVESEHPLTGLWIEAKKHKIAVWVEKCQAQLCGRIYWLKKPLSKAGKPKLDAKNPDASLRDRPQCGLQILTGFSPTKKANVYSGGEIYNPKSGKTYKSKIYIAKDGTLKIRGYVGIPLFGKSVKWERPRENILPCDQNVFASNL